MFLAVFVLALLMGVFVSIAALFAVIGVVLRAVLWLIVLPFKLLFIAITLPFLVVGGVVASVLGIVALVGGVIVGASVLFAGAVSLALPIAAIAGVVWLVVRASRRPATA